MSPSWTFTLFVLARCELQSHEVMLIYVKSDWKVNLKVPESSCFCFDFLFQTHLALSLVVFREYALLFAGVGTRNYYRKMGYELEGPYMTKSLLS